MSSYTQHPLYNTLVNYTNATRRRYFIGILLACIALIIYTNVSKWQGQVNNCELFPQNNSTVSHLSKNHGPPYLAFIISPMPKRLNATLTNLQTVLPGYFNIKHKQSVPFTDSRIVLKGDKYASSLLLSFIDIWTDLGAKSEAELKDNDWIFIFEDDVNIVSMDVIQRFYPQIYAKWNYSNPNTSIAGSKRLFRIKLFECTHIDSSYKVMSIYPRREII